MIVTKSKNYFHLLSRIMLFLIFIWLVFVYCTGKQVSIKTISEVVLISSFLNIVVLFYNKAIYNSGLFMIFFAYTTLVNNGFVIAHFFDESYRTFQSVTSMAFLNNEFYPKAILIANIVIVFFALSTEIKNKNYIEIKSLGDNITKGKNDGTKAADIIAIFLLIVSAVYLTYFVFSKGLWLSGYLNTLNATENGSLYNHVVIWTSLSMAFLVSTGTKNGIKIGMSVYVIICLLHFSMGNRGEVMYSAVVCFALYSIRYRTIKLRHIIISIALAVFLMPLIRIMRNLEMHMYTFNSVSSLLDVLAEEGIEISPFTYIVQYTKYGNGHVWGMTYLNDFADFFCRRLTLENPFAIEQNIIKAIMPYDGMGFSMIAETYYNFGVIGSCIIYFILGRFMIKYDMQFADRTIDEKKKVMVSLAMVELINLTRNDASTLPLYLFYVLVFYSLYSLILNSIIAKKGRIEEGCVRKN